MNKEKIWLKKTIFEINLYFARKLWSPASREACISTRCRIFARSKKLSATEFHVKRPTQLRDTETPSFSSTDPRIYDGGIEKGKVGTTWLIETVNETEWKYLRDAVRQSYENACGHCESKIGTRTRLGKQSQSSRTRLIISARFGKLWNPHDSNAQK